MKASRTLRTVPAAFAALALLAGACSGPRETVRVHGVDLVVGRWTLERAGEGEPDVFLKACLRERARVDGLACERWIRFWTDDVLAQCVLAEDEVVAGHALPAGSTLWFDRDGRLEAAWLAADVELDGIPCDGGWGKIAASFHPNGRLKSAFLVRDAVVQGVPCLASAFHPIVLDADGRLVRCTLSAPFEHGGRTLARGDEWTRRR